MQNVFNGKIYFEIFVTSNENRVIGILSVKRDLTELSQHFISGQGLITDYDIINENIIAVNVGRNNRINETIRSGLRYYNSNIEENYNDFIPLQCSKFPTKVHSIVFEQSS